MNTYVDILYAFLWHTYDITLVAQVYVTNSDHKTI
jgi:hypothetical protein